MFVMDARYYSFILIIVLFSAAETKKTGCPPKEDLPECDCASSDWMICNNIMTPHQLLSIMNFISDYTVYRMSLYDSELMYLPNGMFNNLPMTHLTFSSCSIYGWESENGSVAFAGAEESLNSISLRDIKGIKSWNWSVFAVLKNLQTLDVVSSELGPISENFKHIPSEKLETLFISDCEVDYIEPHAFSKYENLKWLTLQSISLTKVNRSMLPTIARRLESISFTGNKLRNLPEDIFTNMPVLEAVYLNKNNFHHLPFEVVKPIIHNKNWRIALMDNDIYCCSDMAWVIPFGLKIPAICKYPQHLRGYQLGLLRKADFDHGIC
ncbi:leucine-rich repeat-containing protein 15-like [Centruroides vittatus]|uniref:leucine-rich repeat-containing protein 15-like n=1 Tax=Centruroides vittatus TaxID=120091 RepID=UPI00350F5D13